MPIDWTKPIELAPTDWGQPAIPCELLNPVPHVINGYRVRVLTEHRTTEEERPRGLDDWYFDPDGAYHGGNSSYIRVRNVEQPARVSREAAIEALKVMGVDDPSPQSIESAIDGTIPHWHEVGLLVEKLWTADPSQRPKSPKVEAMRHAFETMNGVKCTTGFAQELVDSYEAKLAE
jgi:hypothetical protein